MTNKETEAEKLIRYLKRRPLSEFLIESQTDFIDYDIRNDQHLYHKGSLKEYGWLDEEVKTELENKEYLTKYSKKRIHYAQ